MQRQASSAGAQDPCGGDLGREPRLLAKGDPVGPVRARARARTPPRTRTWPAPWPGRRSRTATPCSSSARAGPRPGDGEAGIQAAGVPSGRQEEAIAHELEQFSERHDLADLIGAARRTATQTSAEERQSVEQAFRGGACRVLAATSTLAAGVSLPGGDLPVPLRVGPEDLVVRGGGRRQEEGLSPRRGTADGGPGGSGRDRHVGRPSWCARGGESTWRRWWAEGHPHHLEPPGPGKGGRGMRRPMLEAVLRWVR